jgi:hypothetical protein
LLEVLKATTASNYSNYCIKQLTQHHAAQHPTTSGTNYDITHLQQATSSNSAASNYIIKQLQQ